MSQIASDGLPLPPSTMSEATLALGHLMHHLPADTLEIDSELGIRIVARNEMGFLRWVGTVNAGQISDGTDLGFHTRAATGVVAGIPVTVILRLGQIGAAS